MSAEDREERGGLPSQDPADDGAEGPVRLTAWVSGRVQGVGFRWWVRSQALALGLTGSATNLEDRRVEVVAEGPRAACEDLLALLRSGGGPDRSGPPGRVTGVVEMWSAARGAGRGFVER